MALQSAAKDSSQWRSSFEQVADWLTSKEAILIGLQQLSCDFERLGQQSNVCEVMNSTLTSASCLRSRDWMLVLHEQSVYRDEALSLVGCVCDFVCY